MTNPTDNEMRVFNNALRAFKHARGTYRRAHATTLAELTKRYPQLLQLVDSVTECQLRYYWR
jgi:hypothetical protein